MGYKTYGAEVPDIMENQELLNQIAELTTQIRGLPKGYISKKTISGKTYYYHQWSENGAKQLSLIHI